MYRRWPTVIGVVMSSGIGKYWSDTSEGAGTRMYGANVRYQYTVNGKKFSSSRVFFGQCSTNRIQESNEILEKYPSNTPVVVYYDPKNPQSAVLEPGKIGTWPFVFISFALVVIGIIPWLNIPYFRRLNPGY